MLLRFNVPVPFYLMGQTKEELDIKVNFKQKGYKIQLSIPGEEPIELSLPNVQFKWVRNANGLQVIVHDQETSRNSLESFCTVDARSQLQSFVQKITSRILRVIRHVGLVPELPETIAFTGKDSDQLWFLGPETSIDGTNWTKLINHSELSESPLKLLLSGSIRPRPFDSAEFNVLYWPRIVEVLEDGKDTSPEDEFLVNTIAHIRTKNFRLALLEAIIGLEIVLTQYLREYLSIGKKIPQKRIGDFLTPQLGLSARLSVLLDLTLHESYLQKIDFDKINIAVGWRNDITHKTGRLPDNIPENSLIDAIQAVLDTARLLAERRDDINAIPEMKKIRDALKASRNMFFPTIWVKPWHMVNIEAKYFIPFPPEEELCVFINEAIEFLKKRDPRFDPQKHLTIWFKEIPDITRRTFKNGTLSPDKRN